MSAAGLRLNYFGCAMLLSVIFCLKALEIKCESPFAPAPAPSAPSPPAAAPPWTECLCVSALLLSFSEPCPLGTFAQLPPPLVTAVSLNQPSLLVFGSSYSFSTSSSFYAACSSLPLLY
jgi:hypothetical protein